MAKKKIDYASMFTRRKDGRYQGSYTDATGRHYVYDRDPEALWHKLNDPKEEKKLLFQEIAQAWQADAWEKIREGTRSCYDAPLNRAIDRFGKFPAAEIEPHEIATHLQHMKVQGYSASTIKKQKIVYKLIFQYAILDKTFSKTIKHNPVMNVALPDNMPRAKQRTAPEDDIVKAIKEKASTAYFGLFAFFLICTGFRRGEALAVRWKDIDFKRKTISCGETVSFRSGRSTLGPPKTASGFRSVPLLDELAAVLDRPDSASDSDFVFCGNSPELPMPQSTYDRRWKHYCIEMGFVTDEPETRVSKQGKSYVVHNYKPSLTAHDLRHGYATMLYEAGVDVYTAMTLLGHADVETTMSIYTHLRNKKKAESLTKLQDYAHKMF